jgi:adenosine deaminase CECR1
MVFNAAKPYMESTQLWKICQRMPKGSLLHCHLGAMVDLAWVIETAIETEGVCIFSEVPLDGNEVREQKDLKVMFSKQGKDGLPSIWSKDYIPLSHVPLKTAVDSFPEGGRAGFVEWLKLRCSITLSDSINHHLGVNEVWRKMQTAFRTIVPMIFYAPILRKFIRKFLETLVEDRVFWVEMRGMSPNLRLDGEEKLANAPLYLVKILDEEIRAFKKSEKGKDFWGARLIWDSLRTKSTGELVQGGL